MQIIYAMPRERIPDSAIRKPRPPRQARPAPVVIPPAAPAISLAETFEIYRRRAQEAIK